MKITMRELKKLIKESVNGSEPPTHVKVGDEFDIKNTKGVATVRVTDISVVYTENGSNEAIITYQYEINNRYGTNDAGAEDFRKLWTNDAKR